MAIWYTSIPRDLFNGAMVILMETALWTDPIWRYWHLNRAYWIYLAFLRTMVEQIARNSMWVSGGDYIYLNHLLPISINKR